MNRIKLSESQAEVLYFDGEIEGFAKVEESPLEADVKYELGTFVVKDLASGKFYQSHVQRSGDYWSDYEYYFQEDFDEVEQVEVVVKQWQKV